MEFEKALVEFKNGKRIRCKHWDPGSFYNSLKGLGDDIMGDDWEVEQTPRKVLAFENTCGSISFVIEGTYDYGWYLKQDLKRIPELDREIK